MALLAAPAAEGLFHKAIALSPGPVNFPPHDGIDRLTNFLGIGEDQLLDKLRSMSGEELSELQLLAGIFGRRRDTSTPSRAGSEASKESSREWSLTCSARTSCAWLNTQAMLPGCIDLTFRRSSTMEFWARHTVQQHRLSSMPMALSSTCCANSTIPRIATFGGCQEAGRPCWRVSRVRGTLTEKAGRFGRLTGRRRAGV